VASDVTLAGALKVSLPSSYKPAVGTLLNVLTAGNLHGRFTSVTLDGYTVTPVYTSTGVQLRIDA
jgi:hypothetical protein